MKRPRRIKAAKITSIALCKQGKNGMRTILKSDGAFEIECLTKSAGENELLAVVYAPNRPDDDGHFATAELIKSWAHEYLRDHRTIDIEHNGKALAPEDAYLAESFVIAKGDERFQNWKNYDNESVGDLSGAWASIIKLEHPVLQKAYRDGELGGVSMSGKAALERVDFSAASKRVAERLGKARDTQQENEMNKEEMLALLSGFKVEMQTLVKSAIEGLKPKAEEKKKDEPAVPVFKGSLTNPTDLEAFENELRTHELNKSMANGTLTADKVAELRKSMAQGEPSDKDAGVEDTDTPREKSLKRELFKARKARNAPAGSPAQDDEVSIAKANHTEGLAIAELFNGRTGASGGMRIVNKDS